MEKGRRWFGQIAEELEASDFGIICVTPASVVAPSLYFEAGALSKSLERSRVCPLVLGLPKSTLTNPLSEFNASDFEKRDMLRLLKTINAAVDRHRAPDASVEAAFAAFWPGLDSQMKPILQAAKAESAPAPASPPRVREDRELLEEILINVRLFASEIAPQVGLHCKLELNVPLGLSTW